MIVYELMHTYYVFHGKPVHSLRMLGLFSCKESANNALLAYQNAPGYCDAPFAFTLRQREVVGEYPKDVIYEAIVYAHTQDYGYDDYEHTVELGLYFSKDAALKAVHTFREDNRLFFRNEKLKFEEIVNKYKVDTTYCAEGFVVEPVSD